MKAGLSKPSMVKTPEQVLAEFHRNGKTVLSWAEEHGFNASMVYGILKGHRKCLRGQSHRIAVRLGIKDGVIDD